MRDETAAIVKDDDGQPVPDSELRDFENVPLKEDIDAYFAREVLPHVPDAWMDRSKDKVGYEISFTKYFYEYTPLRSTAAIAAELLKLDEETENLLRGLLECGDTSPLSLDATCRVEEKRGHVRAVQGVNKGSPRSK